MEKYFDKYNREITFLKDLFKNTEYKFIIRFLHSSSFYCKVTDNETLDKEEKEKTGFGLQVFTNDGGVGFSTSDTISKTSVEKAAKLAIELAKKSETLYKEDLSFLNFVKPFNEKFYPEVKYRKHILTPKEREGKIQNLQNEISQMLPDFSVNSVMSIVENEWRIIRDDGTDTSFFIPRSFVISTLVYKKDNKAVSMFAYYNDKGYDVFFEDEKMKLFKNRVRMKEKLCKEVINAASIKSGSYKLLIDYGLAKGLAHEAFGHAIESDQANKSILFENGKFMKGKKIASDIVNIIDESIEGDNAYQPVSANGILRERVEIVKDGILNAGLGDMFSALKSDMSISGACRSQSYQHIPMSRMSNIRIEVKNPEPLNKEFEEVIPEDLYKILNDKGVLDDGPVIYMTGYKGGQVNPKYGDFVFNCSIMYKIEKDKPIEVYRPGIFSGKILEALKSIKFGIGKPIINAIGTCGKNNQSVPSSGGSNMFIFIDKSEYIKIGGESK